MDSGENQEQALEHEKQAHYEATVPDQEKRDTFAAAGITENVKEFLWEVKSTQPESEGTLKSKKKHYELNVMRHFMLLMSSLLMQKMQEIKRELQNLKKIN